ncbi:MAG TPA: peptidoglycan endopeptidase [Alteraurantiacibacter sp.]|jgi:cell wall-associated NlpC family hydrolase
MSKVGDALARAALELAGTRFLLRGRDPATGLDCVGLVACALEAAGRRAALPHDYAIRNRSVAHLLHFARDAGFGEAAGAIAAGDLLLVRTAPAQYHLLIAAPPNGFVHAHAGLRRVAITPGPLPWPIERRWRLTDSSEEHD